MLTIDGRKFNVAIRAGSLQRDFAIAEGAGSLAFIDGDVDPDIIGTYYNYSMEIDTKLTAPEEYDALWEVLSAPVEYHVVSFPYAQNTLTFEARITGGSDSFYRRINNKNYWGQMSVSFTAKKPQRTP